MELLTPKLGLFFWTLVIFVILLVLLSKFAWKPIMAAIKAREESIENSLLEAQKAREEMSKLTAENENLLRQARVEREEILKEARELKERIVNESREEGKAEATRMVDAAREEIQAEKMRALTEIKNQVGSLSLEVATKILRKEMEKSSERDAMIDTLITDLNLS